MLYSVSHTGHCHHVGNWQHPAEIELYITVTTYVSIYICTYVCRHINKLYLPNRLEPNMPTWFIRLVEHTVEVTYYNYIENSDAPIIGKILKISLSATILQYQLMVKYVLAFC